LEEADTGGESVVKCESGEDDEVVKKDEGADNSKLHFELPNIIDIIREGSLARPLYTA